MVFHKEQDGVPPPMAVNSLNTLTGLLKIEDLVKRLHNLNDLRVQIRGERAYISPEVIGRGVQSVYIRVGNVK